MKNRDTQIHVYKQNVIVKIKRKQCGRFKKEKKGGGNLGVGIKKQDEEKRRNEREKKRGGGGKTGKHDYTQNADALKKRKKDRKKKLLGKKERENITYNV